MDLTRSFLNAAGAEVSDGGELDGIDILAHVQETVTRLHEKLERWEKETVSMR